MSISIGGNQAQYTFTRDSIGTIYIAEKADPSIIVTAMLGEDITFADNSILNFYEYTDDSGDQPLLITAVDTIAGIADITWTGSDPIEMYGYNGDDTFTGGSGEDYFDGGDGMDTVIASGNQADYRFGVTGYGNNLYVTGNVDDPDGLNGVDGPDNFDVLRNIETVQFTDGNITIHETTARLESEAGAESSTITTLADGTQVIVWKELGGIRVQHFNGEMLLSSELLADTDAAQEPVVAALNDGFVISWSQNSEIVPSQFFTQVFDQNAGSIQLNQTITGSADRWDLSTTALSNGSYVIGWTEEIHGDAQDHAFVQLFNANGESVGQAIALTTGIASYPSVAALNNGGFVAVWENEDAKGNAEIYLQRFTAAGVKDGKAIQVNTGTAGDQIDPQVVTLKDGSYVVSWTREDTSANIFMQRYSESGAKLGAETQVNTTSGFYSQPSVTALTSGGYVVTWATLDDYEGSNGTNFVYAQMFGKDGAKVGIELIVAKSTSQNFYPQVTATEEGGFAVVWDSSRVNNPDSHDVYYKIFDANGNFRTLTGDDGDNWIQWSGTTGVTLEGGLGSDTLIGADATDLLIGGAGADNMIGGKGNDIYVVDDILDTVFENANEGTDTVRSSVSFTLSDNVENLTLTGSDNIDATGNLLANVLTGNAGDNRLDGGAGADTLIGGAGDDTYLVDNAKDTIVEYEGEGIDLVEASITWTLGANLEYLTLGGTDTINGTGNALDNILIGNSNKNTLNGGEGDDVLDGRAGADRLIGGKGSDTFLVDLVLKGSGAKAVVALEDTITEAANGGDNDTLMLRGTWATDGTTTLTLGANLETFNASLSGLTKLNLTGNGLANTLIGNASANVLNGGAGVDTLIGGDGDDTYVLDSVAELALVEEEVGEGSDTLRITFKGAADVNAVAVNLSAINLANVENVVIAGTGAFNIIGNDQNNTLDAGKTASILSGGQGDDTYWVGHKDAQVIEDDANGANGTDSVFASVSFTLGDNIENLTLTGKAALNGTGNALDNVIVGNDGANILDGGAGADDLIGGKGNDTYIVDDIGDVVTEEINAGTDTIKASISFDLNDTQFVENLTLTGSGDLTATGNALNNILTGNIGANTLDGGAGVDKLLGGAGDDTYIVDLITKGSGTKVTVALQDTITEKKGEGDADTLVLRADGDVASAANGATKATTLTLANYLENVDASSTGFMKLNLTGNAANNVITGNEADNAINGGAGNDVIDGGDGDDLIIGGLGADTMTGGTGSDIFSFTSLKDLGFDETQDVITDFTSGEDILNFKAFKGWSFDATATGATGTKQLWAVLDGGDTIVYGNSGGSTDADFSIRLQGVTSISETDFSFV
ncbi:calcium-binding protein [Pseudomonas sp. B11D7D]|nr:calcium-binding protein [Pseudomonas sp. B11D7D]QNH05972.1 calcium-binding protein [Pseudomonas sp. B11D7D]